MPKRHPAQREEVFETQVRRVRVKVGYRQTCAVCGKRFPSKRPADTCGPTCRSGLSRSRQSQAPR